MLKSNCQIAVKQDLATPHFCTLSHVTHSPSRLPLLITTGCAYALSVVSGRRMLSASRATLSRISNAARFVNVAHSIRSGSTPLRMAEKMRRESISVFPDPGGASTRWRPDASATTSACSSVSCMGRQTSMIARCAFGESFLCETPVPRLSFQLVAVTPSSLRIFASTIRLALSGRPATGL